MQTLNLNQNSLFFKIYLTIFNYLPSDTCTLIRNSFVVAILIIPLTLFSLPLLVLRNFKKVRQFISDRSSSNFNLVDINFLSLMLYGVLYLVYSLIICLNLIFNITNDPFTNSLSGFNLVTSVIGLTIIFTVAIIIAAYSIAYLIIAINTLIIKIRFKHITRSRPKRITKELSIFTTIKTLYKNIKDKTCSKINYI